MTIFGKEWSRSLCDVCANLSQPGYTVYPEWILAVFALESGFDPHAKNASGAFGLAQRMPPYMATDPVQQLLDYGVFTKSMRDRFAVERSFCSREGIYCANLAPARLARGQGPEVVLYSAPSRAYVENAAPFGLNPKDPVGVLRLGNLAHGLDAAVARCRSRYDAEVEAAYAAQVTG